MADVRDLTVEILKQIRDEIRNTREDLGARLDQTNARLDQTNARLDQTNARLERIDDRLTHVEESMSDMAAQQRTLARHAEVSLERETRIERDLVVLRSRVDAIESRLPPAGGGRKRG